YLYGMRDAGRRRILLIDAPAVLGAEENAEIDDRHGGRTLREGVAEAIAAGDLPDLPVAELADILDAMFDRAALSAGTEEEERYRIAIRGVITGLAKGTAG